MAAHVTFPNGIVSGIPSQMMLLGFSSAQMILPTPPAGSSHLMPHVKKHTASRHSQQQVFSSVPTSTTARHTAPTE